MKKNFGEDMKCAGCGYVFKPREKPSAMANYGPGETQGPFYWCKTCSPPISDAKGAAKALDTFMRDSS